MADYKETLAQVEAVYADICYYQDLIAVSRPHLKKSQLIAEKALKSIQGYSQSLASLYIKFYQDIATLIAEETSIKDTKDSKMTYSPTIFKAAIDPLSPSADSDLEKKYQALFTPTSSDTSLSSSDSKLEQESAFQEFIKAFMRVFIKKFPLQFFWPREALFYLLIDEEDGQYENPFIYDEPREVEVLEIPWEEKPGCLVRKKEEGESGYMINMTNAYLFIEYSFQTPLSIDYIVFLHDVAIRELPGFIPELREENQFINNFSFKINSLTGTMEGIKEIVEQYSDLVKITVLPSDKVIDKNSDFKGIAEQLKAKKIAIGVKSLIKNPKILAQKIEQLIKEYNVNIARAKTDNEKILAIVKFLRPLELMHPFDDGNARTFGFLLSNKLLIEQGLGPAIVNPNKMDGHSCTQYAAIIEKGITLAKSVREREIKKLDKKVQEFFATYCCEKSPSAAVVAKNG